MRLRISGAGLSQEFDCLVDLTQKQMAGPQRPVIISDGRIARVKARRFFDIGDSTWAGRDISA
jgi:hypothetical protein